MRKEEVKSHGETFSSFPSLVYQDKIHKRKGEIIFFSLFHSRQAGDSHWWRAASGGGEEGRKTPGGVLQERGRERDEIGEGEIWQGVEHSRVENVFLCLLKSCGEESKGRYGRRKREGRV